MSPIIAFSIFAASSTAFVFGLIAIRYALQKAGFGPQLDKLKAYLDARQHKIDAFRYGVGMSLLNGASAVSRAPLVGSKHAAGVHQNMADTMCKAYRKDQD